MTTLEEFLNTLDFALLEQQQIALNEILHYPNQTPKLTDPDKKALRGLRNLVDRLVDLKLSK